MRGCGQIEIQKLYYDDAEQIELNQSTLTIDNLFTMSYSRKLHVFACALFVVRPVLCMVD